MSGHVCIVYSGPGLASTCVTGTSVPNCPTKNVLGTCSYTLSAGGIAESVTTTYYSDGMFMAAAAETACMGFMSDGSVWVPGP